MPERIEVGFMAFLADGREGIGAVRALARDSVTIYVENAGEFSVPFSAVKDVHDQKVILDARKLDRAFLTAVGHAHDGEDPKLVG
jgi:streptomycin 6-kinase